MPDTNSNEFRDEIKRVIKDAERENPTPKPIKYFGDDENDSLLLAGLLNAISTRIGNVPHRTATKLAEMIKTEIIRAIRTEIGYYIHEEFNKIREAIGLDSTRWVTPGTGSSKSNRPRKQVPKKAGKIGPIDLDDIMDL